MKILYISNGYPPWQWAGTETYTAGLAKGLRAAGHDVQVLCGGHWSRGERYWNGVVDEVVDGVPVRRINLNWTKAPDPARYLYDDPESAAFLRGYLAEVQPDVVHVTSCERLSAGVLPVVKEAGLPLVLSLTDFWFLCPRMSLHRSDGANCDGQTSAWDCLECTLRHSRVYRWADRVLPDQAKRHSLLAISRRPEWTRLRGLRGMAADMTARKSFLHWALTLPDRRLTASRFVRDRFVANGVKAPIDLHPYGHDLSWLKEPAANTETAEFRIGYIGQMIPIKGVHLLLQAVARLTTGGCAPIRVKLYGDPNKLPTYGEQLADLASALPHVEFCGTYPREAGAAIFDGLDVLVVPSLWYDFPLVIHEAFATKTPVIASRLGGMAESVQDGVNGLLFTPGDVDDLARQLARLVADRTLWRRLRANIGPVKSVATEVRELVSMYEELLSPRAALSPPAYCNYAKKGI